LIVGQAYSLLWLELTGRCQLLCDHCYADSGPHRDHGAMKVADWLRVIDQAAQLGVPMVQLIGGEPTLHPELPTLTQAALDRGMGVEIYSNLVRVTPGLWHTFEQPGVQLATSYYSSLPEAHNAVTRRASHAKTLGNIREAIGRNIPLRVSVIELGPSQRVETAQAELRAIGVTQIGVDRLRHVGRGIEKGRKQFGPSQDQLCGACAEGKLAVSPNGDVWPCVFSRWLTIGNVRQCSLADLDQQAEGIRHELRASFTARSKSPCLPPNPCEPVICPPTCAPACAPSRPRLTELSARRHTKPISAKG
jgi:MoaA/NifB/PqqE/SkfB family radical SAM enzyme